MKNIQLANRKQGSGLEPHPNAIEANRIKEEKQNKAFDRIETLRMIFRQDTKLGKEMKKEQEARLKRRNKWLKEKGLAV